MLEVDIQYATHAHQTTAPYANCPLLPKCFDFYPLHVVTPQCIPPHIESHPCTRSPFKTIMTFFLPSTTTPRNQARLYSNLSRWHRQTKLYSMRPLQQSKTGCPSAPHQSNMAYPSPHCRDDCTVLPRSATPRFRRNGSPHHKKSSYAIGY